MFEVEGCFVFHFFNAFETAGELIVDVAAHHHEAPLNSLSIQNLSDGSPSLGGIPTRFRMHLRTGRVTTERLSEVLCEFPQIAYQQCHGRLYRFGYGASACRSRDGYESRLIKLDTETGALWEFSDTSWIPGEALFVPRRSTHAEDDGYLLSVASHVNDQRSRLWILDASDLSDIATVDVPHLVPLGFHGQFFRDVDG